MAAKTRVVDMDFAAYAVGLCYASACTNLDNDGATSRMNTEHPTGISSRWSIADEPFNAGTKSEVPNCSPCPDAPGRRHLLFSC